MNRKLQTAESASFQLYNKVHHQSCTLEKQANRATRLKLVYNLGGEKKDFMLSHPLFVFDSCLSPASPD